MKQYLWAFSLLLCISLQVRSQNQQPTYPSSKKSSTEQSTANKKEPLINPVLIGGINVSRVWGDQLTGYRRFGFNGGAGAYVRLPKNFSVSFEILYSQKGAKSGPGELMVDSGRTYNETKLIMDYIDLPIMVSYTDKHRAMFSAGLDYVNLVRFENLRRIDTTGAVEIPYNYNPSPPYRIPGLEFIAAITLIIAKHYGIDLGYHHSLTNINSAPISYSTERNHSQQMDYLSLRFMYFFYRP